MIRHDPLDENVFLSTLSDEERGRLEPHLREEKLTLGEYLEGSASGRNKVYFPLSGIISLVLHMADGRTGEIAMVGHEGLVGSTRLLPSKPPASESVVQAEGTALVLPLAVAMKELRRGEQFSRRLLSFSQALTAQIAQTALCNRHHLMEQQFARWILMSLDRLRSPDVTMTQDLIANMLGVRREGVSGAARGLQEAGIIAYSRGTISVIDANALKEHCCECYQVVREQYEKFQLH